MWCWSVKGDDIFVLMIGDLLVLVRGGIECNLRS